MQNIRVGEAHFRVGFLLKISVLSWAIKINKVNSYPVGIEKGNYTREMRSYVVVELQAVYYDSNSKKLKIISLAAAVVSPFHYKNYKTYLNN